MSGGSYNYIYSTLHDECAGEMYDKEMDVMILDLCEVLHDLEWWQSADCSEESYRESVSRFKDKWFKKEEEEVENKDTEELKKLNQKILSAYYAENYNISFNKEEMQQLLVLFIELITIKADKEDLTSKELLKQTVKDYFKLQIDDKKTDKEVVAILGYNTDMCKIIDNSFSFTILPL